MKKLSIAIIVSSVAFALIFWIADSVYEFFMFGTNLNFMLYEEPLSFWDSLITNIPPHALFNRLSFLAACLLAGTIAVVLVARWRESQALYQVISDNFPNGALFLFDHRFRYLAAGGKGMNYFGFSSKEIVGKKVQDAFPEIWETLRPYCENALKGEESYWETHYGDRDLANTFIPVKGIGPGRKRQGIVVTQDITHKKAAEKEKARLELELHQSQKMEAIGRLAGGVSHDLNNLLTPILGFGQLLLEDCEPNHPTHESLTEIVKAGFRARDLVRQLLAFSRKQTLQYTTVDLNKAVANFQKLLRHTIREDIHISFVPCAHIQMVLADIGQIEQVIMNLAVNAQDAMDKGGHLTFETQMVELDQAYLKKHPSSKPGPHVMLAVSDTGAGMDKETQSRIFEPFFSTKGDHGTGLGLATVYGIVKQHGGNIGFYSEPDKGTIFKIYLPVSRNAVHADKEEAVSSTKLMGTETILLVEDSEPVKKLAHTILVQQGYTLMEAENAEQALKLQKSSHGPVDLLFTDVVMPGMNGKELYNKMAEKMPDLKVLYMSGYTDSVIAPHGVLDEGVHFIQKPFTNQALLTKVRQVLDQSPCTRPAPKEASRKTTIQ